MELFEVFGAFCSKTNYKVAFTEYKVWYAITPQNMQNPDLDCTTGDYTSMWKVAFTKTFTQQQQNPRSMFQHCCISKHYMPEFKVLYLLNLGTSQLVISGDQPCLINLLNCLIVGNYKCKEIGKSLIGHILIWRFIRI